MHDSFDVFAFLVIPSLVGAGTILVSIAALVASSRATRLGRQVEAQRETAEAERARDQSRRRLQDMAIEEARTLQRYVTEAYGASPGWHVSTPVGQPMQRTPYQQAEVDAEVALQQSLVPGALDLLTLTQFDIINRELLKPTDGHGGVPEDMRLEWNHLRAARGKRAHQRILTWALDPESEAPNLAVELAQLEADMESYSLSGQMPSWLANLPDGVRILRRPKDE